jgi:glyoxylase-like metal-dependent hydrolase (beta-lactamase superfamily II)
MVQTAGEIDIRISCPTSFVDLRADIAWIELLIVNAYLLGYPGAGSGEWVLVDAGFRTSHKRILQAAEERFGEHSRPAAIILTHGHFDHVGGLKRLADHWDVPIFAHELELPYLTGRSSYPPPDPFVGGGAMAVLSPAYPRGPIDVHERVFALPQDGSVPGAPGWLWIHTPGHAPGHVSLWRESDRSMIVGDAFVTTRQESMFAALRKPREVNGPPKYYTCDWDLARESVAKLAALEPETAATGHGIPMFGRELRAGLQYLVNEFDRVARPSRGRYVYVPAITNSEGVVEVPEPAVPWTRVMAVALAVGAVIGLVAGAAAKGRRAPGNGRSGETYIAM